MFLEKAKVFKFVWYYLPDASHGSNILPANIDIVWLNGLRHFVNDIFHIVNTILWTTPDKILIFKFTLLCFLIWVQTMIHLISKLKISC